MSQFLRNDQLADRQQVAHRLGLQLEPPHPDRPDDPAHPDGPDGRREGGFFIEVEDHLIGVLLMGGELSRLAVNCVTAGCFSRPLTIRRMLAQLDAGFRLLNFKNDALRRKFDGLKYDLKRTEEVVYDLSMRGLLTLEATGSGEQDTEKTD